jgi:hypothetical protein
MAVLHVLLRLPVRVFQEVRLGNIIMGDQCMVDARPFMSHIMGMRIEGTPRVTVIKPTGQLLFQITIMESVAAIQATIVATMVLEA